MLISQAEARLVRVPVGHRRGAVGPARPALRPAAGRGAGRRPRPTAWPSSTSRWRRTSTASKRWLPPRRGSRSATASSSCPAVLAWASSSTPRRCRSSRWTRRRAGRDHDGLQRVPQLLRGLRVSGASSARSASALAATAAPEGVLPGRGQLDHVTAPVVGVRVT